MTKQHFIALADTMRFCKPSKVAKPKGYAHRLEAWQGIVDELVTFCQHQNPRFLRQRWLRYINGECGPNGGVLK